MLMYTSCGWFFDDLSGIETIEILQFAGRAIQLAQDLFGDSLETNFVRRLAAAQSNVAEEGDGARVYDRRVRSAKVDWQKLAANYALSNLLDDFPERNAIYCYDAGLEDHRLFNAGRAKLGIGRIQLRSRITRESAKLAFAALHLGDHSMTASVAQSPDEAAYETLIASIVEPFMRADLTATLREIERCLGGSHHSLHSLFRDEQRNVLRTILAANLQEAETLYRHIYEPREFLLRFLTDLGIPLPKGFSAAADFVLNTQLRAALEQPSIDVKRVIGLLESARLEGVTLETATLEFACRQSLERLAARVAAEPSLAALEQLRDAMSVLRHLPFSVDLWQVQNFYFQLVTPLYPLHREARRSGDREARQSGDEIARRWIACFQDLGRMLHVKVPE